MNSAQPDLELADPAEPGDEAWATDDVDDIITPRDAAAGGARGALVAAAAGAAAPTAATGADAPSESAPDAGRSDLERTRLLYASVTLGVVAEGMGIALLTALADAALRGAGFFVWLGLMAAGYVYRLLLWLRYRGGFDGVGEAWRAERGMTRAAALSGAGWAIAPVLVLPGGSPLQQGLTALVIGAVALVGLDVLRASLRAARWFVTPCVAGMALTLMVQGGPARWTAAALLLAFLTLLYGVLRRRHDSLLAAIEARLNNERLLAQLEAANRALADARRDESLVFDTALVGIAIMKNDRVARCNRKLEEIFGYRRGALQGASTKVLYGGDAAWREASAYMMEDLRSCGLHDAEREFFRRDGTPIWCRYRGQPLDSARVDAGTIWVFEDLTEQKRAAEELMRGEEELVAADRQRRAANARLLDALESVPDAIALFDAADRLINCNQCYIEHFPGSPPRATLLGKTYEQLLSMAVEAGDPVPPEYRKNRPGWVAARMSWHRRRSGENLVYQTTFGNWYQLRERATSDGGVVVLRTDVTELKEIEERVRHLAYHDALTGLPNRRLLDDRLAQACNMAGRSGSLVGVMLIDLDRFKIINDTRGHEAGDIVLKEVAARLQRAVRKVDTVARQGGDEFVVVLTELKRPADAARVAKKILTIVGAPIFIQNEPHEVGASIGIAVFPHDSKDPDGMLKLADQAMYRAKHAGRGGYEFFSRQPTQDEFKFD